MVNFSPEKLLLVGIIALIVLGPQRLPNAARTLGRFVAEMRQMSSSLQSRVGDVLAEPRDALTSLASESGLTEAGRAVRNGVAEVRDGISGAAGAGRSAPEPSLGGAPTPTPPPGPGWPPAPDDVSLN
jgi:sec-independent protein translocase protein TatB